MCIRDSTKSSQNRKTISFHAREPSAMATSPVKRRLSPKNCSSPGRCLIYSWNVAKHLRKRKLRSRVRHWAQTRAKKVKKTLDFCFFAFFFLKLRNTEHARKSLTIFSSRMCRLPKRLRASAWQHFPEGTCVPLSNTLRLLEPWENPRRRKQYRVVC